MRDRHLTCPDYRGRLADRQRRLASLLPESEGLPDDHRATVAVTWSLSIEQANQLTPVGLARPLLEVASVLDPNGIPLTVFTAPAVLSWLGDATGGAVRAEDAVDGLGCLQRLSLITLEPGPSVRTVRVHALVQRATRDSLPGDRFAAVVRVAADAVTWAWPEIAPDAALSQLCHANASTLADVGAEHLWAGQCHPVLLRVGGSLRENGRLRHAQRYLEWLRATATERFGPDHMDTLTARYALASLRGQVGDPAGAVAALTELHRDAVRVLGVDHPHVLTARHNLAHWRAEAGQLERAAGEFAALLADRLRLLGPDHPHTLAARRALAHWTGHAGHPERALASYEELLPDVLRVLGPDHPDTLATRLGAARWRGQAGDRAGAAAGLERLLPDAVRVLGPNHPLVVVARHGFTRHPDLP
jgi:hypothetical protein